ncbi:MAG TPA: ATP-dependent DNA helicase [Candidatus Acidoferrum sp.]|nr:ATP-dependent DNA helicase [Candidatus Acidoferrum sp.]
MPVRGARQPMGGTFNNSPELFASGGFPLNAEQRLAVEHADGPLLVVAGAGTGKTRVITERIRLLLESDPNLGGENILGLTFTDKAAGEMKSRVVKAFGERAEGVWLSTFHTFCLEKILRSADVRIEALDDLDHKILLRRNIGRLQLKHFKRLQAPSEFLADFVTFFSRCQDELVTPEDYRRYVEQVRTRFETRKDSLEPDERAIQQEFVERQEELGRAFCVSEELLRERRLTTFGAQILNAVKLLQTDAALLARLREEYRYILVDEFQDTNVAQLELLWLLAGDRRNIMAVGDHNQAIYRFRGASYGSFTIFLERFCGIRGPKQRSPNARRAGANADGEPQAQLAQPDLFARRSLVTLSQNYRSTKRILNVAHAVICNNEQSPLLPDGRLNTENREGDKIRVVEFSGPREEAHWVASEIERLHEAGAHWDSMAVLYRNHTHRDFLVGALQRRGIPFVIRRFSILSSTLIRDLLAWLRLIGQPSDNVACARVLAAPYWGLEPRDLVRLAERAEKNHRRPLWDEVDAAQSELPFARTGTHLPELVALVKQLRQSARRKPVSELLDELIGALGVAPLPSEADRYYLDRFVNFIDAWERKSLAETEPREAAESAARPTNANFLLGADSPQKESKRLRDFLEYLYYFNEARGDVWLDDHPADDAVELMTVHGAKGLEFPHVFVIHLSKRDFPTPGRRPVFEFPPELMKEETPEGDFHIQEERRLFYVALTRARQRLTLCTIVNKWKKESPFLDDFLQDRKVKMFDAQQLTPKISLPLIEEAAAPEPDSADPSDLFAAARVLALRRGELQEPTRAYSRVALWAKAFHPPRPEPLQLSASAINAYESCPMKYMLGRMWSLRGGPHAEATFGSVMHTTIQEFVRELRQGRKVSAGDLLMIYHREWSSAGFPDDYHETEYRNEGREALEKFHVTYTAEPAEVVHQEKVFELPLDPEIIVVGRIDQVNRLGRKEYEIVDYKTGRPKDAKKAADDLQLSIYALAARDVLEINPSRLTFYNLMTNEAVYTTRDAKALAAAKQRIAEVADRIRGGDFTPKPGYGCAGCDYKPLCPAHEQLVSIRPSRIAGGNLS